MTFGRRIRAYFLTGLVVAAPIAITVWVTWWFVSLFDRWVKPLIPSAYNPDSYLPFNMPGVGLVLALVGITLIGALAANLVGRTIIRFWERLLNGMPVIRSIYKAMKQIFETVFAQTGTNFQQVALVEFPRKGVYVVVFVSRHIDSSEIGLEPGTPMISAFMPTTPNPTTGFLFFVRRDEAIVVDLTVEDAAKLVISAGLVTPGSIHSLPQEGIAVAPAAGLSQQTADELLRRVRRGRAGSAAPVREET